jgi:hypothetical protein
MHVALVNRSEKIIEYAESYDLEASAFPRYQSLRYEAEERGPYWEAYYGSEPFAFPTPEEEAAAQKASERQALFAELAALDAKAIRPMRAIGAGTATQADRDTLAAIEARASDIREALT